MPPKKEKFKDFTYALIWFISTRERFVVETIKLLKTRRKKGDVVKILWEDSSTQISKRYDVKILEFDNDKSKLENILLDEDGNVCDENAKLFYRSVLDKKRLLQQEAKKDITKNKIQKNSLAHVIAKKKPLFDRTKSILNNPEASTSKSNDFLQQCQVSAQVTECSDTSSVQCSPQLNVNRLFNVSACEIDTSEPSLLDVNNTKNAEVPQFQCSIAYSKNAAITTSEGDNNVYNTNGENIKDLTLSVPNEVEIGALHTFFPATASEENIKFLRQIYAGLSKAYEHQQINTDEKIKSFKVSEQHKKEIYPNCGIFFPIDMIETIEKNAITETGVVDWRKLVKAALTEIYGDDISNYCVIGRNKNSLRPPIDRDIYHGIYKWIVLKSTEQITNPDYTNEINKMIGNKRTSKVSTYSSTDTISEGELQFFQKVISAVEQENKWHQASDDRLSLMNSKSRDNYLTPGPTKARISDQHNIFFPKSTIAYIEKRTESSVSSNLSDWKNLVKEALIAVYDKNMDSYCAKGVRTSRSPIHPQLYQAILAWANSRSDKKIDEAQYISHINKIASNKRKTNKIKSVKETLVEPNNQHSNFEQQNTALAHNSTTEIYNPTLKLNLPLSEPAQQQLAPHVPPAKSDSRPDEHQKELSPQFGISSPSESQQDTLLNIHSVNQDSKIVNSQNLVLDDRRADKHKLYSTESRNISPPEREYVSPCVYPVNRHSWTTQDQDPRMAQSWMASPYQYPNLYYNDQHSPSYMAQNYNYYPPVKNLNENNEVLMQQVYNDNEYQYQNRSTHLVDDDGNPTFMIL